MSGYIKWILIWIGGVIIFIAFIFLFYLPIVATNKETELFRKNFKSQMNLKIIADALENYYSQYSSIPGESNSIHEIRHDVLSDYVHTNYKLKTDDIIIIPLPRDFIIMMRTPPDDIKNVFVDPHVGTNFLFFKNSKYFVILGLGPDKILNIRKKYLSENAFSIDPLMRFTSGLISPSLILNIYDPTNGVLSPGDIIYSHEF